MNKDTDITTIKKWITAVRPFSLPASTMPVLFGTVMAVVMNGVVFRPLLFLLAFASMVTLHCGANIMSDAYDFRRGLDTVPTPVSGAVVRGYISPEQAFTVSSMLIALGASMGLLLAWLTTPWLLVIGGLGIAVGVAYTGGPFPLKYHALGDLAVFLDFGVLGSLGSWMVQTGSFSWLPVFWSVPMSLLVIAILHANNWRDIESDSRGKIVTVASILGDRGSLAYYILLITIPFASVGAAVLVPRIAPIGIVPMPLTFLTVMAALPLAVSLVRKALARKNPADPMDFIALDGATAQLNLLFGMLCTAALVIHIFTGPAS